MNSPIEKITSTLLMATIIHIVLLSIILSIIFFWCRCMNSKGKIPTNWPIIGMIPAGFVNLHRFQDFVDDFLEASGGTFEFKGPWFANLDKFFTCHPDNVHHILSKKFPNYGKGPQFKKIFAPLGGGIFNSEAETWKIQRKTAHAIFHNKGFEEFLVTSTWNKVEKGLIPVLDHVSKLGINVDFQDLVHRFSFDLTCILFLDYDPDSLSVELPEFPLKQAFSAFEEGIFYRHLLPETVWRLQHWFQIGKEKKMSKAVDLIDEFLAHQIASKLEKMKNMDNILSYEDGCFDFLTGYMKTLEENRSVSDIPENILRDTVFNFMFAGKDTIGATLTWFFWLMAKNPVEETKIREEITRNLQEHKDGGLGLTKVEKINKLIYLHGALCETLRLFPPVPLQHKAPSETDILPSGHRLQPHTETVLSFYAMGRTEQIWGKDCLEFKPHRWISERGSIKNVPSFKFTAFNAGPRSCLGKEMSFIELKIVASAILYHFEFKVVEGQCILPCNSVVLDMKNGLMVRVSKRH